jgi:Flp pilus assembly protein TadB
MPEKYQEEIEEILKRADETAPVGPARELKKDSSNVSRLSRRADLPHQSPPRSTARWPSLSTGKIALAGLVLLLVGAVWMGLLIWVGLGLLVLAYLLFFVTPRSISYEKRWRGRPLEARPSPWQRFIRWLKG